MEFEKDLVSDKFSMRSLSAKWTLGNDTYESDSVACISGRGFLKIKLDHAAGTFIFDKNTSSTYPDFKIEFYLNGNE